jgi:hypothetical protein
MLSPTCGGGLLGVVVPPAPTPPSGTPAPKQPALKVRTLTWHSGVLTLVVSGLPKDAKLHVDLEYAHRHLRRVIVARERLRLRTARPRLVVLRVFAGKRQEGATVPTHVP